MSSTRLKQAGSIVVGPRQTLGSSVPGFGTRNRIDRSALSICSSLRYSRSAPSPSKRSSAGSDEGSRATRRLCSRANSVCTAVSATFSFARMSPATTAFAGVSASGPSSSIGGAVSASPRAAARGR